MSIHLIMPMGGAGTRFYKEGYMQPKPLIEILDRPFFYWSAMSIARFVEVQDITFVVLKQHIEGFHIGCTIKKYFPEAHIVILDEMLPGPVFTAMRGTEEIEDDLPLIFNDCDHMFKCSEINDILNSGKIHFDGGLLTFESSEPQFSYVVYDETHRIIGTVEKKVMSSHAICGAYLFRNVDLFRNIAEHYIMNCPYNECFMSGMYSIMCERGLIVKDFLLDYHVEFGTPEEYEVAKASPYFIEMTKDI